MREVDYDTGYRLRDGRKGTISSNTKIVYRYGWYEVELFGNVIAKYNGGNVLKITTAGYYTLTTINRLNGILNAFSGDTIKRKNGSYLFNGEQWDGKEKTIEL